MTKLCAIFFADDLSYRKTATQSPIYPSTNTFYVASNAVDRKATTCMRTDQIGNGTSNKITWWKVDLGAIYNIYSIDIFFKNYIGYGVYCLKFSYVYTTSMLNSVHFLTIWLRDSSKIVFINFLQ